MRCTDCEFFKELIPEELRDGFCTKFRAIVSVSKEFNVCPYEVGEAVEDEHHNQNC